MDLLYIILGLAMLIFGSNLLLKSAVSLSVKLKLSRIFIGMTIVSFVTSSPELIVSLKAALLGYADMSFGNVIGSNITNITIGLGITILISPIVVNSDFLKKEWSILFFVSILFYVSIFLDYKLNRIEGIIFLVILAIFLYIMIKSNNPNDIEDEDIDYNEEFNPLKVILFLILGGVLLWSGSELIIDNAVSMARYFDVSERIISISVISVGTSIPEIATCLVAAIKKEKSISIGTLIGSNIFNILAVLGIVSLIQPIVVFDEKIISQDMIWFLIISFILLPLCIIPKKWKLGRVEGIILVGLYVSLVYVMFFST